MLKNKIFSLKNQNKIKVKEAQPGKELGREEGEERAFQAEETVGVQAQRWESTLYVMNRKQWVTPQAKTRLFFKYSLKSKIRTSHIF